VSFKPTWYLSTYKEQGNLKSKYHYSRTGIELVNFGISITISKN